MAAQNQESNLPLSTEESTRDDADSASRVLMRGNQEAFPRGLAERRPSSIERSVLTQPVRTLKREREQGLASDTATQSFNSTYEETPCKKLCSNEGSINGELDKAAAYTKEDSNGQPYHWRVDTNERKLHLCPGNAPGTKDEDFPQCYFKFMYEPHSFAGRLTVLNNSYTVALDTENLPMGSLVVKASEDKPINNDGDPTAVYRLHSDSTDKYVFYYKYKNSFYPIRPDFHNKTLIVEKANNLPALRNDPLYQWTKVPETAT